MTFDEVILKKKIRDLRAKIVKLNEDNLVLEHLMDASAYEHSRINIIIPTVPTFHESTIWLGPASEVGDTVYIGGSHGAHTTNTFDTGYNPSLSWGDLWAQ